jgi:Cof subfamily protein (haloacid dehalogenase superfamily)
MPYSLLVCDLDGTLIDHTLLLDPELVGAFRRAGEAGLLISIATGRMPAATTRYRDELMIRAPVIYYNGALVRDTLSGDDLLSVTLPCGVLRHAYDVFGHSPVHPLFYRDDRLYCLEQSLPVRAYCDEEGLRAEVIPDPSDFLSLGAFVKSLLIGHPEALPVVREELEGVVGAGAKLLRTRSNYLEVVPVGASKGSALARLAEHIGIPLARVIAVGDQENDLEMIRAAGMGVAMPNAPEFVRAAADRVAPAPEAGGLLAVFRELIPEYFA